VIMLTPRQDATKMIHKRSDMFQESSQISRLFCATAFDDALRRYPYFGHAAVDNVPLSHFTFWASKRSQVLTQPARLDRRQRHYRIAIHALRTLVLRVEHELHPPGHHNDVRILLRNSGQLLFAFGRHCADLEPTAVSDLQAKT
jgi:hypothetical protein